MPAFHVVSVAARLRLQRPPHHHPGGAPRKIAAAWVQLMGRLGYDRFLAHGGDWGGNIHHGARGRFPGQSWASTPCSRRHRRGCRGRADGGRAQMDRGDPRLLASPGGVREAAGHEAADPRVFAGRLPGGAARLDPRQVAEWSGHRGQPFETISIDAILDDVTLYWLTRTGASAARIYYESHNSLDPELRVDVPSAITM